MFFVGVVVSTIERLPIQEGQALKTLYIIGNGFDIAHNLPTSYWHFREYLEDMHQDFLADFEYLYNIGRIGLSDPRESERTVSKWKKAICDTLWSDFEDKMGRPNILMRCWMLRIVS